LCESIRTISTRKWMQTILVSALQEMDASEMRGWNDYQNFTAPSQKNMDDARMWVQPWGISKGSWIHDIFNIYQNAKNQQQNWKFVSIWGGQQTMILQKRTEACFCFFPLFFFPFLSLFTLIKSIYQSLSLLMTSTNYLVRKTIEAPNLQDQTINFMDAIPNTDPISLVTL